MATPAPTPSAGTGVPAPAPSTTPAPPAVPPSGGPVPHPSPGTLTDPDGKDISQGDTDSDRHRRAAELDALRPTAPPLVGVGFDVQPQHVYYASFMLRNAQYDFADRARKLVGALDGYEHAVGCGTGPEAFAKAYAEVAGLFLDVWNRTTEGVGGAVVGLTVTANNYTAADHATNVLVPAVPQTRNPPDVLKNSGTSGPVAQLGWGAADGDDGWGDAVIDEVSGALSEIGAHILRPILEHALRHGKVADITPGGDDTALPRIAALWRQAATDATTSAADFDAALASITNPAPGNDEWQSAMRQFCSAMWGTSAWGKPRENYHWNHTDGRQPSLEVLQDTARAIATACDACSTQVTTIRSTIIDVYKDAAIKTFTIKSFKDFAELIGELPTLAAEFLLNIDTGRLNSAVDSYNNTIHDLADDLTRRKPALEEARRSVPAYAAEEARAEAFGARSLDEFKKELRPGDPQDIKNGVYRVDLASTEGIDGAHTFDKHVGKTDEQLAQRLRDQGGPPTQSWPHGKPSVGASSTFISSERAQDLTQYNIDQHSSEIQAWLGRPPSQANNDLYLPVDSTAPNGEYSGRSVTKQDNSQEKGYKTEGLNAKAVNVTGVRTVLKYDASLTPPFVVLTSMPTV
ncbi:RNase A-like domain-containing protein [Streptomyces niveiscabiei]|uniref:RNase A-like domain-containing protein n=1 Tax=Streptomyces niveiscabiei TaxID=164115 RepID=A0ABW9HU30_9ACTN